MMPTDPLPPLTPDEFGQLRQEANGDWLQFAHDARVREGLAACLAAAGHHDELFALVAESGAWAEARYLREENYSGYLADLDLAWQWCESDAGWSVGRQIRCALIAASLQAPAAELSPALLAQAVETGLWSPARALGHVRGMSDDFRRADALARLAPLLPEILKSDALESALRIKNEYARSNVLSELMPHLPNRLKVEVFEAARSIIDQAIRSMTLGGLAWLLPDELKVEAFSESWQAALTDMAGDSTEPLLQMPEDSETVAETLQAAPSIDDETAWVDAMSEIAPELPDVLQAAASEAETAKVEALADALQAARAITGESARADALIGLAPLLTDALKVEAFQAARALADPEARARALSGMSPYLPDALKAEALDDAWQAAHTIGDGYRQADTLSGLAPHLSDEYKAQALDQAWEAALAVSETDDRARALSRVVSLLPAELAAEALAQALQAAQRMTTAHARASLLSELAVYLPDELKVQAVADAVRDAQAIGDEPAQAHALNGLHSYLNTEGARSADPGSEEPRLNYPGGWAPFGLGPEALSARLRAARANPDEEWRAYTFSTLAPYLPEAERAAVLPEAFELASRVASPAGAERRRAGVLNRVINAWKAIGFAGLAEGRPVWRSTLRTLAGHRRPELLYDLTALLPLVDQVGGAEALRAIPLAIHDVVRWWP